MKIIDLDRLTSPKRINAAAVIVRSCYRKTKDQIVQTEPLYWFSTAGKGRDQIENMNLPALGTALQGPSLQAILKDMISKVDAVASQCGMGTVGKFRRPVTLLTDREIPEAESLNVTILPLQLLDFGT